MQDRDYMSTECFVVYRDDTKNGETDGRATRKGLWIMGCAMLKEGVHIPRVIPCECTSHSALTQLSQTEQQKCLILWTLNPAPYTLNQTP